jgi:hypothetical protein
MFTCSQPRIIAVVKYRVPVGLPAGGKKYLSRTRLDSGRVRVPPMGKKSSLYPSGRVLDGYQVPVPELPSQQLDTHPKTKSRGNRKRHRQFLAAATDAEKILMKTGTGHQK